MHLQLLESPAIFAGFQEPPGLIFHLAQLTSDLINIFRGALTCMLKLH